MGVSEAFNQIRVSHELLEPNFLGIQNGFHLLFQFLGHLIDLSGLIYRLLTLVEIVLYSICTSKYSKMPFIDFIEYPT